jgi:hypothetical protein
VAFAHLASMPSFGSYLKSICSERLLRSLRVHSSGSLPKPITPFQFCMRGNKPNRLRQTFVA